MCWAEIQPLPSPQRPYILNEPQVHFHQLHRKDKFIIAASDGLWDEISSDLAVNAVGHFLRTHGRLLDEVVGGPPASPYGIASRRGAAGDRIDSWWQANDSDAPFPGGLPYSVGTVAAAPVGRSWGGSETSRSARVDFWVRTITPRIGRPEGTLSWVVL